MRVWLPFMLGAGCGFSAPLGGGTSTDADTTDVITIDGCTSFSTQVNTCAVPAGGDQPLVLTGANTYDTDTNVLVLDDASMRNPPHLVVDGIDVLFVSSFHLMPGASLRLETGDHMFGIVASGTIQIDGRVGLVGPSAGSRTDTECGTSEGGDGGDRNQGSGGGGGGGFQGAGGIGGLGDTNGTASASGMSGAAIARPARLLAGCDGGSGGMANGVRALGGDGGGAILLAAGTSITIGAQGVIIAGGSGGSGGSVGSQNGGGGGGGSGGMILLESETVTVDGVLTANGGGGGEGAASGTAGQAGQPCQPSDLAAAGGTAGDGDGGNGGAGSGLVMTTAQITGRAGQSKEAGGGGGGGGAGFIAIKCPSPAVNGTVSPAWMSWP